MPRGHALIVDDSSTARIILARLLERADISSRGVGSAEDAFPLLQREEFDLIFLDHLLPGMDGFQTLEKLKSQSSTRDIPVFMYTSQNADRYVQDARARGAAGVIGKQVEREQLVQMIDAILSGRSTEDEEIPLVQENGQYQSIADQSYTRRLTGRLSTLEIAYEEANEDIRHLKQACARMEAQHREELDSSQRRSRRLSLLNLVFLVVAVIAVALEINGLSNTVDGIDTRLNLMSEMLGGLMELIGGS